MRKPETTFRLGIERHLPRLLHREKMNNPYRGGTADSWYSGRRADLWVEYKWMPYVPKTTALKPDLTALQRQWLNRRYEEGRNVSVVLGCPDGAVIYTGGTWDIAIDTALCLALLAGRRTVASWIEGVTCGGQSVSWRPQP